MPATPTTTGVRMRWQYVSVSQMPLPVSISILLLLFFLFFGLLLMQYFSRRSCRDTSSNKRSQKDTLLACRSGCARSSPSTLFGCAFVPIFTLFFHRDERDSAIEMTARHRKKFCRSASSCLLEICRYRSPAIHLSSCLSFFPPKRPLLHPRHPPTHVSRA